MPKKRLVSLDAFRGMVMAVMVIVNSPCGWPVYPPLAHAKWNGLTIADAIFPLFLFIVGVSIPFSFANRLKGPAQGDLLLRIARRSAILIGLGILFGLYPKFQVENIRLLGILQGIAVAYFITSILILKTHWKTQAATASGLLLTYWLLMAFFPVPGFGAGISTREGNFSTYLDQVLGVPDMLKGFLSLLGMISSALLGALTGTWIRSSYSDSVKARGMLVAGIGALGLGWLWAYSFPFNKRLFSSSYSVFTAGGGLCLLAFCYWLIDIKQYRKWAWPFVVLGMNAIFLYASSTLLVRFMAYTNISLADGSALTIRRYYFLYVFASVTPIQVASLMSAASILFFMFFWTWALYRKKIFLKL